MNWLILRTDHAKEHYVARQVQNLAFDAWVPAQIIVSRPSIARRVTAKTQLQKIRELPLLPRRVFAAIPQWALLQGELDHIRHLLAVERDGESRPLWVPSAEIKAFKAAIDAENTAALALAQKASRKQKAKWKSLHDALMELIEGAKTQMEQAA